MVIYYTILWVHTLHHDLHIDESQHCLSVIFLFYTTKVELPGDNIAVNTEYIHILQEGQTALPSRMILKFGMFTGGVSARRGGGGKGGKNTPEVK